MLRIFLAFLFLHTIRTVISRCTFENYNFDYPPVFVQNIENDEIVLKPLGQQLHISEGGSLKAYCDTNFSAPLFGRSDSEGTSSVIVKCKKGNIYYEETDDENDKSHEPREQLVCHGSQPEFYSTYASDHCQTARGKSLAYGFTVNHKQIVLSTVCFNFDLMDVIYVHYKGLGNSFKLQDTRYERVYLNSENRVQINLIGSNENRTQELNSFFHHNSEMLPNTDIFRFDYLVPIERLVKSYPYQLDILEGPNSIPWSINLKDGNWKLFEQLLENQMIDNYFDIYTGVAYGFEVQQMRNVKDERDRENQRLLEEARNRERRLRLAEEELKLKRYDEEKRPQPIKATTPPPRPTYHYPPFKPYGLSVNRPRRAAFVDSFYYDDIKYVSGSVIKSIPLFVWTYLQSAGGDANSTVVVGVNSPFIDIDRYYAIDFCRDECPIWLNALKSSAKIPTLGYMFCCRPEKARDYIPGFP